MGKGSFKLVPSIPSSALDRYLISRHLECYPPPDPSLVDELNSLWELVTIPRPSWVSTTRTMVTLGWNTSDQTFGDMVLESQQDPMFTYRIWSSKHSNTIIIRIPIETRSPKVQDWFVDLSIRSQEMNDE